MIKLFSGSFKSGLAILMALVIFSISPLVHAALISEQQVTQAIIDAEAQAARDNSGTLWFFLGCLGGVITIGAAALITPSVPQTALLGKPADYVASYSDAYVSKAKRIRTNNALYGCGVWVVAWVLIYVLAFAAAASTDLGYYY